MTPVTRSSGRRAGLLVPLFSCPSTTSWGVGDVGDVAPMAAWLAGAGHRVLQLLPLNEMAPGQQSPYSAISAMAADPIFIRAQDIPEFASWGGEAALSAGDRDVLDHARRAPRIDYSAVRALKRTALAAAFDRFLTAEWDRDTARAREFRMFLATEAWWVEDYAVFRALHALHAERPWTEWPDDIQRRLPDAIARARRELGREVLFYQYLQWIADSQWRSARASARAYGVQLFGDLPFMVDGDSADVWARQQEFRLDVSVGVPPDAFSATGQDWGMPLCRWDVMAGNSFEWLKGRARRSAALYDGYRVDHLVGFYRTYARPRDGGDPFFTPPEESEQVALGERIMAIFRESGAEIVAEDLGTVPDFVRASLARLSVPGYRVFRWERHWHVEAEPFRDPAQDPAVSVATSGTHDTEPMIVWWQKASDEERALVVELPTVKGAAAGRRLGEEPYIPVVRDVLLEALYRSNSDLVLLPIQDVFGWADRVNEPATIGDQNWTYRLPWPSDGLDGVPEARERQVAMRSWAEASERT
jgi:4-alpha-glucanotransferase